MTEEDTPTEGAAEPAPVYDGPAPLPMLVDFASISNSGHAGRMFYLMLGEKAPWTDAITPVASLRMTPESYLRILMAMAVNWNKFNQVQVAEEGQVEFSIDGPGVEFITKLTPTAHALIKDEVERGGRDK